MNLQWRAANMASRAQRVNDDRCRVIHRFTGLQ
jgi:hypothetical protein